uniref:Uncharacterized protein n=1 Tax=viral metagenome TaxID=1070528 RepID=A0A6C0BRA8_9ZZZZ
MKEGFITLFFFIIILSALILNFASYGKMGKRGYINNGLYLTLAALYFVCIGTQIISPYNNYKKGITDVDFYRNATIGNIPKIIFLGCLFYSGIVDVMYYEDLNKGVKDEMGQEVTQEKILRDSYDDYFTFKLLADIFLFIMFIIIVAFAFAEENIIQSVYDNREYIKHWGVMVGFGVFTILYVVFQSLKHDILKQFITDGFQLIPKKFIKYLK